MGQISRDEVPCFRSQVNHPSLTHGELIRLKCNVTRVVAVVSFDKVLGVLERQSDAWCSGSYHMDESTSYVAGLAISFGRDVPPTSSRMRTAACEDVVVELHWLGRNNLPVVDIRMMVDGGR